MQKILQRSRVRVDGRPTAATDIAQLGRHSVAAAERFAGRSTVTGSAAASGCDGSAEAANIGILGQQTVPSPSHADVHIIVGLVDVVVDDLVAAPASTGDRIASTAAAAINEQQRFGINVRSDQQIAAAQRYKSATVVRIVDFVFVTAERTARSRLRQTGESTFRQSDSQLLGGGGDETQANGRQ